MHVQVSNKIRELYVQGVQFVQSQVKSKIENEIIRLINHNFHKVCDVKAFL